LQEEFIIGFQKDFVTHTTCCSIKWSS